MIWVLTGTAAFVILIIFEVQKCRNALKNRTAFNPWFVLGTLMLLLSFVGIAMDNHAAGGARLVSGVVIMTAGVLSYIIVLTAGLKKRGYLEDEQNASVSRKGLYGRLRHPGVWSFLLCGVGFGMVFIGTTGKTLWLVLLNLIYTWLQDRYFFPVYLKGYEEYKRDVPYLFPKI